MLRPPPHGSTRVVNGLTAEAWKSVITPPPLLKQELRRGIVRDAEATLLLVNFYGMYGYYCEHHPRYQIHPHQKNK